MSISIEEIKKLQEEKLRDFIILVNEFNGQDLVLNFQAFDYNETIFLSVTFNEGNDANSVQFENIGEAWAFIEGYKKAKHAGEDK